MTGTAAMAVASLCMALTGGLGVVFALSPARGMALASHVADRLPAVMADRYIGTAFLLLGVLLMGDWRLLAWFMAVVGIAGLGDVAIYARDGRPVGPHLIASGLYGLGAALALVTHMGQGAAS